MQDRGAYDEWLQASRLAAQQGQHGLGAEQARRALQCHRTGEGLALLALHELRLGELRDCIASSHAALALLQEPGSAAQLALAECTLTVACLQSEFVQQAMRHAQRAVSAAEQSGDPHALAWSHLRLGQAHRVLGDIDSADALFERALAEATDLGDAGLLFSIHYNRAWPVVEQLLGGARVAPQPLLEALARLERAQPLAEAAGNQHSAGLCLLNRSRCLLGLGRHSEGRPLAEHALAIGRAHGLTQLIVGAQTAVAECLLTIGQAAPALQELERAQQTLSDADLIGQVTLLRSIVDAHRALGQYEAALDAFGELHDLAMQQARARADLQAWTLLHQQQLDHERQRAQRAELMAEVERLSAARWQAEAHQDPLTGLANRRFLNARLEVLGAHAQRSGQPLLVALIDLDHFKAVNDHFGHQVGDRVLHALGLLLQQHVRPRDTPARLGGEEFLVLLSETDPRQAVTICERLRVLIAEFAWGDIAAGLQLTASIGLAAVGEPDAPFVAADQALYRAKAEGRNRLVADL